MNTMTLAYNDYVIDEPIIQDRRFLNKFAAIVMAFALLIYCALPAIACYTQAEIASYHDAAVMAAKALGVASASAASAQAAAEVALELAVAAEASILLAPLAPALLTAALASEAIALFLANQLPGLATAATLAAALYTAATLDPCCPTQN
jgi:hypothetical protein